MFVIQLCSRCLSTHLHCLHSLRTAKVVTKNSARNGNKENHVVVNYLINTLDFAKSKALAVSNSCHWVRSVEKTELVVHFFKFIGFTDAKIQYIVHSVPRILIADVEKIIKPKIQLFQELVSRIGGSNLCKLISSHASLLTRSVEKAIKPSIKVLDKVLVNGNENGDFFRVLQRSDWVIQRSPQLRLIPNILYLESIGIVGSRLSLLLKNQPRLLTVPQSELKKRVSKLLDIGFSTNARIMTHENFLRKLQLFQSFVFSKNKCMEMFRVTPSLFRTSEKKIKLGLFFLETMKFKKSSLVQHPNLLMFSMEKRVTPRYQVLQLIKSKKLVKKEPSFYFVMCLPEHLFLEKFVSRFEETVEELLMAYKGRSLDVGEDLTFFVFLKVKYVGDLTRLQDVLLFSTI
ncbi:unnamed protein product [Withania somnifera]